MTEDRELFVKREIALLKTKIMLETHQLEGMRRNRDFFINSASTKEDIAQLDARIKRQEDKIIHDQTELSTYKKELTFGSFMQNPEPDPI